MKRPLYNIIRLVLVFLPVLLTVAPATAQTVVNQGRTTELSVEAKPGDSYFWELYSKPVANFAVTPGNILPGQAYFVNGNSGPSVNVSWLKAGTFYYKVTAVDQSGCTNNLKVGRIVVVEKVNCPPIAVDDYYSTGCNTITGNLLDNDSDPDGDNLIISTTPVVSPVLGKVTIFAGGNFRYEFERGISGSDHFVYEICDDAAKQRCAQADVYITISLDFDCDDVPDSIDIDDDNDGIIDTVEGDGAIDSDNDGIPDSLDIDSDNDGIPDNIEGQSETHYDPPSGIDTNHNGLDDIYETDSNLGITPVDTDDDGTPDYLDQDSDNDHVPDKIEGQDSNMDGVADVTPSGQDSDSDGLDDAYDTIDRLAAADNETGSNASLQDSDGDGIRDWRDADDDNDDLLTIDEDSDGDDDPTNDDCNRNGIPNYLDPESCDLLIPNAFSPNGDGINDYLRIQGIDQYPDAHIIIFNRWGIKIYEKENYGNINLYGEPDAWWDGRANTKGSSDDILPVGTYFIILKLNHSTVHKGIVYIIH